MRTGLRERGRGASRRSPLIRIPSAPSSEPHAQQCDPPWGLAFSVPSVVRFPHRQPPTTAPPAVELERAEWLTVRRALAARDRAPRCGEPGAAGGGGSRTALRERPRRSTGV